MNEKIRELISQSYEYAVVTTIDPFTQEVVTDYIDGTKPIFNKEKFAELIVRECMNICKEHSSRIVSNNWVADAVAPDIVSQFEEHFGVEE